MPDIDIAVELVQQTVDINVEMVGGGGRVDEVVAGENVAVNSTDPAAPVVSVPEIPAADVQIDTTGFVDPATPNPLDAQTAWSAFDAVVNGQVLPTVNGLGTASTHDVSTGGDAAADEVVLGSDSRLDDARTPTAHAATHAAGGSDPITPASIGAATSAQGALADTAVQPGDLATVATSGAYADLTGVPSPGGRVDTVVAGAGVSVDATDPTAPVVSVTTWTGPAASRPATGDYAGRMYLATDAGVASWWDGTAWQDVAAGGRTLALLMPDSADRILWSTPGSGFVGVWKSHPVFTSASFAMPASGLRAEASMVVSSAGGGSVPAGGGGSLQVGLQYSTDSGATWTNFQAHPALAGNGLTSWATGGWMPGVEGVLTTGTVAAGTPIMVRYALMTTNGSNTYKSFILPGTGNALYRPSYVLVSAL